MSTTPLAPTNVTATVTGSNVTLSWAGAPTGQGYNIYQAGSASALSTLPLTINGGSPAAGGPSSPLLTGTNSHTFTNLANGTYFFAVTTWDCSTLPCTESTHSIAVSVTVPAQVVVPPPLTFTATLTATVGSVPVVTTDASGTVTIVVTCKSINLDMQQN